MSIKIYLFEPKFVYPSAVWLSPLEYLKENSSSTGLKVSSPHPDPLLCCVPFSFSQLNISPTCILLYLHIVYLIVHVQIYEYVNISYEKRLDKSNEEA